jgi:hypothetical protein
MLGAYTMEKLCTDCAGEFRDFIRRFLTDHLRAPAPPWLENVIGSQN